MICKCFFLRLSSSTLFTFSYETTIKKRKKERKRMIVYTVSMTFRFRFCLLISELTKEERWITANYIQRALGIHIERTESCELYYQQWNRLVMFKPCSGHQSICKIRPSQQHSCIKAYRNANIMLCKVFTTTHDSSLLPAPWMLIWLKCHLYSMENDDGNHALYISVRIFFLFLFTVILRIFMSWAEVWEPRSVLHGLISKVHSSPSS